MGLTLELAPPVNPAGTGRVDFPVTLEASQTDPTYTLAPGPGVWGAAPHAYYSVDPDGMADVSYRFVGGLPFGSWDPGEGTWIVPLPDEIAPLLLPGPVPGNAQVVGGGDAGAPIHTCLVEVDPPWSTSGLVMFRSGDRTLTGATPDCIVGVPYDPDDPGAGSFNPAGVTGIVVIVALSARFRVAA